MERGASFMDLALAEARAAAGRGEVPVGAVLVRGGEVLAAEGNRMRQTGDPTAHAEMLVLSGTARRLGAGRLVGAHLYVTLEPCTMCAAAIAFARVSRLYFGASDPKGGAVVSGVRFFDQPTCHHRPEVYDGIGEGEARALLETFFRGLRDGRRGGTGEGAP